MGGNIYSVRHLRYEDRIGELRTKIQLHPGDKREKILPIFHGEDDGRYLFKALSKSKPFCNDLYAIAEVYCSRVLEHYFEVEAQIYQLARCEGISESLPYKYEKGVFVRMFTEPGERVMDFADYFQQEGQDKSSTVYDLVSNFINYCGQWYDFTPFFKDAIFVDNSEFSDKLAYQVLVSMLFEDSNFHYGNAGFVVDQENKVIDLAPIYDNEFSFIFNAVHNPRLRVLNYGDFRFTGGNRERNIDYLVRYKRTIVEDFLKGVRRMISDEEGLRHFSDVSNLGDFIENLDSRMWRVHRFRKEGQSSKAEALEKRLNESRPDICVDLSEHIYRSQLEILHRILAELERRITLVSVST